MFSFSIRITLVLREKRGYREANPLLFLPRFAMGQCAHIALPNGFLGVKVPLGRSLAYGVRIRGLDS